VGSVKPGSILHLLSRRQLYSTRFRPSTAPAGVGHQNQVLHFDIRGGGKQVDGWFLTFGMVRVSDRCPIKDGLICLVVSSRRGGNPRPIPDQGRVDALAIHHLQL